MGQWLHNDSVQADSAEASTRDLVEPVIDEEIATLPGEPGVYVEARATFVDVAIADDFAEFLTIPAYEPIPRLGVSCVRPLGSRRGDNEVFSLPWPCGWRSRGYGIPAGRWPARPGQLPRP